MRLNAMKALRSARQENARAASALNTGWTRLIFDTFYFYYVN